MGVVAVIIIQLIIVVIVFGKIRIVAGHRQIVRFVIYNTLIPGFVFLIGILIRVDTTENKVVV